MSGWLARYMQRQRELAQGVDADLVSDNRRRYAIAWRLLGLAFLLLFLGAKVPMPRILRNVFLGAIMAALVGGFVMAQWARLGQASLEKPDPEEPPSIFKK
jgi:hypothetical protein